MLARLSFVCCIALSLSGCSALRANDEDVAIRDGRFGTECSPCIISFVRLLANPEQFHGRKIAVIGYLVSSESRGLVLFLSKESAVNRVLEDAVELADAGNNQIFENIEGKNGELGLSGALVVGTFDAKRVGFGSSSAFGTIYGAYWVDTHTLPPRL